MRKNTPSKELPARREATIAASSRYFMRIKTCKFLSQMPGKAMRVGVVILRTRYGLGYAPAEERS